MSASAAALRKGTACSWRYLEERFGQALHCTFHVRSDALRQRRGPFWEVEIFADFSYRLRADRQPLTIGDWRRRARRRVPDMVWAYIENGADDERTAQANVEAFRQWRLRQRVLAGSGVPDLTTTVAGIRLDLPLLIAPTGLAGAAHWEGEVALARAAERHGTRLVLSSASTYSIEEVASATEAPHWFQLYPWRDHTLIDHLIGRAERSGYTALVVTVDVPVYGNRLRERRTGMAVPPTISPTRALSAALRPRWVYHLLRDQRVSLKNLEPSEGDGILESVAVQSANLTAEMSWADLEWIRRRWAGPLFVKGVLDPEDAQRAVDLGADGIIVSNHGGRQLNGAPATLEALPAIARQIGENAEVLLDGGVRTGPDVVIARALGARACLIGRPMLYGLAGGGTGGVESVLRILREELVRTLTLMGVAQLDHLDTGSVLPAAQPAGRR
jgi:L-lactate dehydrogenase (cytochrome)/(S)-mandelate dehydrogenase